MSEGTSRLGPYPYEFDPDADPIEVVNRSFTADRHRAEMRNVPLSTLRMRPRAETNGHGPHSSVPPPS